MTQDKPTIEDVKDLIRYYVPVRQHADIVINQLIKIVTQPFSGKETRESVLESVMQRTGAILFNSARETALIAMTEYAAFLNRQGWTEGFNWKEEYDQAVNEIGQLQEQLKEAENEIRSLQSELNSR
jgi:hypothetical protein